MLKKLRIKRRKMDVVKRIGNEWTNEWLHRSYDVKEWINRK